MSGINKVILVGYVGKDPDVKYLEGGVAMAKFSLATSETYKDKNGNRVDQTEWHNVVMWRGLAEVAEKYVRKGKLLYIEGKIKTRTVGEEGNKKYYTDIVADTMTMLGGRGDSSQDQRSNSESVVESPIGASGTEPSDDLPF